MRKRYVASKRHTIQVDFDDYLFDTRARAQERRRSAPRRAASRCPSPRARAGAPDREARWPRERSSTIGAARGKREATKAANRAAILDAAREVFADIGFGAA